MWLNTDVMMKVFNEYSAAVDQIYAYAEEHGLTASEAMEELGDKIDAFGLKAFQAAQEARTFGDAIDSIKDAASTAWMNTFELIFGNYEQSKVIWTDLANNAYDVFVEPINKLNVKLKKTLGSNFVKESRDVKDFMKLGFDETEMSAMLEPMVLPLTR